MAVLQNIRVKFGVLISVIIALALLTFIIDPSTIESAMNSMSSKYDVGNINGNKISYTDFEANVDKFTKINQIVTGSSVQNEQIQEQIRNAAWEDFIYKYLFIKNAKDAGITVGKAELVSLTSVENASPVIAQNPFFMDESGTFDREKFVEFIQNLDNDESGQLRTYWDYLQTTIYNNQFYSKYLALFVNGDYLNAIDKKNLIEENNTVMDIDYIAVPLDSYASDSTFRVKTSEAKKYYKSHKKFFKQQEGRDIEYVVFEVIPSDDDIIAQSDKFQALYDEFVSTSNLKSFLAKNSDRSYTEYWYGEGELNTVSPAIEAYVASKPSGASVVFRDGLKFQAARVIKSGMVPDSVYVKHILLDAGAKNQADSLCKAIAAGSDFESNAALYSIDKGSAADGQLGNIGWMTQTYIIPGFEPAITAEVGKPFVLKTQYGTHVVLVSKRTKPVFKSQVAIFEKTTLPSKETISEYYSQANRFATIADGSFNGYKEAVDSMGVYSYRLNAIPESTSNYGPIDNAKEVTRWIFDAKENKASGVIAVENNKYFFVAAVTGIHKEGYATFDEVSSGIEQILMNEKVAQRNEEELTAKAEGLDNMEAVAKAVDFPVINRSGMSFTSFDLSDNDPALLGAAYALPAGKISKPVAGISSAYIIKVANKDKGSFFTEADAVNSAARISEYGVQMLIPTMMDDADVKDHRARFF